MGDNDDDDDEDHHHHHHVNHCDAAAKFYSCIREMMGSNLGEGTGYPEGFLGFP